MGETGSKRAAGSAAGVWLLTMPLLAVPAAAVWGPAVWGQNGHRITAEIAHRHLGAQARGVVEQILAGDKLAQIATWPDEIRSVPEWKFVDPWHYVTVDEGTGLREVCAKAAEKSSVDNVLEAIEFFEHILAGEEEDTRRFERMLDENHVATEDRLESTRKMALAFLVHFIGDVHQPLHVGRGPDLGGNKVSVDWFGEESNLHKVWDEGLIESEHLSFTEFVSFIDRPAEECRDWQSAEPLQWAQESIDARARIYAAWDQADFRIGSPELSYQYVRAHLPTVRERLLQGGVRLAGRLDALLEQ